VLNENEGLYTISINPSNQQLARTCPRGYLLFFFLSSFSFIENHILWTLLAFLLASPAIHHSFVAFYSLVNQFYICIAISHISTSFTY
jgi:hypothetical protein